MTNKDIEIAPDLGAEMFGEETTEDAVARIVARDPGKHGVTLGERKARAAEAARRLAPTEDEQATYERRVREIGGDPDEMMVGNKPRYTMDEDGNVKDHETGDTYITPAPAASGDEARVEEVPAGQAVVQGGTGQGTEGLPDSSLQSDHADRAQDKGDPGPPEIQPSHDATGDDAATEDQPPLLVGATGRAAIDGAPEVILEMSPDALRDPYCEHVWPEPQVTGQTPCSKCGLPWGAFAGVEMMGGVAELVDAPSEIAGNPAAAASPTSGDSGVGAGGPQETIAGSNPAPAPIPCEHQWPDDPQAETLCAWCGMKFEDWANS